MSIEILDGTKVIKIVSFDLIGITQGAMWHSFDRYWNRYFGHQTRYSWRTLR